VCDPAETAAARIDLDTALAKLTPDSRTAVVLRDFCDLPYEEIAEVLGVPIGTVRSRIARARATLADLLSSKSDLDSPRAERSRESNRNQRPTRDVELSEDDTEPAKVDFDSRRKVRPQERRPIHRESQP
jgi:predicted DNA-binding protein (UPF0251 family)